MKVTSNQAEILRRIEAVIGEHYRSVIADAIRRVQSGDVKRTQHGVRVATRRELGDNRSRSQAEAYWPKGNLLDVRSDCKCQCHRFKRERMCSHLVAAAILLHTSAERAA